MIIDLPIPEHWPLVGQTPSGERTYEVYPAVTLVLKPLQPLPADLKAWGDRVVLHRTEGAYRVRNVEDLETEAGWPVTLFTSDIVDAQTRRVFERRLHALYVFLYHGGVAKLRSPVPERFDAAMDEVRTVLLKARPRWRTDEICALSEIWSGLDLEREAQPVSAEPEVPAAPGPALGAKETD